MLGLCLLVAVADEVHQGFVPRRGFWWGDVGIDLAGGALGALFAGPGTGRAGRVAEDSRGHLGVAASRVVN